MQRQKNPTVFRSTLFVSLCMVSSFAFSQPSRTQNNVSFSTGLSYNQDSVNTGSYNDRERSFSMPLRLSVDLNPSLSVTARTSLVMVSSESITSVGVVSQSASGLSDSELSVAYRRRSDPSSNWPSLLLTGSLDLLAGGLSISADESEEARLGSIGVAVEWPFISINGRVGFPVVESLDSSDIEVSIAYASVRSASVGVELERQFHPVVISASGNVGYSGEYDFFNFDVKDLTVTPGLNFNLEFGARLFVNEEITFISSVGVDIEKDVRVNNAVVDGSGAESMALDLGLLYSINRSHTISPSLNIDIAERGRSSTLSFNYSHRF